MKNTKIIDERQELQSLKNAKTCWILIIMLLALSVVIQTLVYSLNIGYYLPECLILTFACIFNILLDIKQGNLYTKDNSNIKRNMLLYIGISFIFSLLLGVGNYIKWHFPAHLIIVVVLPAFICMLSAMLLIDYIVRKSMKKRMDSLESKLLHEPDLSESIDEDNTKN